MNNYNAIGNFIWIIVGQIIFKYKIVSYSNAHYQVKYVLFSDAYKTKRSSLVIVLSTRIRSIQFCERIHVLGYVEESLCFVLEDT